MDKWIERFRNTTPINAANKVLIPGDPEREMEIERMQNGIPVVDAIVKDLENLAEKFNSKILVYCFFTTELAEL